jgi:hypothetical protein
MDSGKFSSAAVNRLLKNTGANRAISEIMCFIQRLASRNSNQMGRRRKRMEKHSDEERAG